MDAAACDKCNTPLDEQGTCVTCRAQRDGLELLGRSGYASIMEVLELLQEAGVAAELEQVPPRREEEKAKPLWNLYAPKDQLPQARAFLQKDRADMLGGEAAVAAADRGLAGVDLDAGGEITCPACGHVFAPKPGESDCPDCGLSLGAPAEAAPDEGH
jgi:uncharacterized Zn finger protein (UPF0148 family)